MFLLMMQLAERLFNRGDKVTCVLLIEMGPVPQAGCWHSNLCHKQLGMVNSMKCH